MAQKRILALSSSRVGNEIYFQNARKLINQFLGEKPLNIAFIPFASADNDYEEYTLKVKGGMGDVPYSIQTVYPENAKEVIEACDVIMVGGGNTFKLLHDIYAYQLLEIIQKKVNTGTPYIGWSAGANLTGLTIGTTNDMPVIEPESFKAFAFFPFQINPHYANLLTAGFNGETRDQRLLEFMKINKGVSIIGLPEGTALLLENAKFTLIGQSAGVFFKPGENSVREAIEPGVDLSYLL